LCDETGCLETITTDDATTGTLDCQGGRTRASMTMVVQIVSEK
jgi:hypothetical protein